MSIQFHLLNGNNNLLRDQANMCRILIFFNGKKIVYDILNLRMAKIFYPTAFKWDIYIDEILFTSSYVKLDNFNLACW